MPNADELGWVERQIRENEQRVKAARERFEALRAAARADVRNAQGIPNATISFSDSTNGFAAHQGGGEVRAFTLEQGRGAVLVTDADGEFVAQVDVAFPATAGRCRWPMGQWVWQARGKSARGC